MKKLFSHILTPTVYCALPIINLLLALCTVNPISAEVIVLQSGKTLQGEILIQNEEMILLRDTSGRRYQFPRSEVTDIRMPEAEEITVAPQEQSETRGKVALRLDFAGGGEMVTAYHNGGFGSVDVAIGTRNLANRRIFLGGSVGYHAAVAGDTNHFIPLMAVVSVPLMDGRHAPEIGAGLGYGFSVKTPQKGGITAQLDLGWRYQYAAHSALLLGVRTRFQQAKVGYTEIIGGKEYDSPQGRCFVSVGVRLALLF